MLYIIRYNVITGNYGYETKEDMVTINIDMMNHGINRYFITNNKEKFEKKIEDLERRYNKK